MKRVLCAVVLVVLGSGAASAQMHRLVLPHASLPYTRIVSQSCLDQYNYCLAHGTDPAVCKTVEKRCVERTHNQ